MIFVMGAGGFRVPDCPGISLAKVEYIAGEITAGHFYQRPGRWCSYCDFLPVCLGDEGERPAGSDQDNRAESLRITSNLG